MTARQPSDAVLVASGVRLEPESEPIDEAVRRGELVGLAGLEGHGQERFLRALAGLEPPSAGEVLARDRGGLLRRVRSLRDAVRAGVAYLPRDRKTEGLFGPLTVLDNFVAASLPSSSRFGLLRWSRIGARYAGLARRLSIAAPSPLAPIGGLSGGNQQKVLLARWMATEPSVMLLNDPTRGVDAITRGILGDLFRSVVDEGASIVIVSTELDELLQLCQRVLVFREGRVFARLPRAELSRERLLHGMFGEREVRRP